MVGFLLMCPEADLEDVERTSTPSSDCASAFAYFGDTGSSRIAAFNSDSPHLPTSILRAAFQLL